MINKLNFESLVSELVQLHHQSEQQTTKAINVGMTIRNWLIGHHIVEYEQNGEDRAKYGEKLLESIAEEFKKKKIKGMSETNLKVFRQFYEFYPQIRQSLNDQSYFPIRQTVSDEFKLEKSQTVSDKSDSQIIQTLSEESQKPIRESLSPEFALSGKELLSKLSFSHISELIKINDQLKRSFYEVECIRGTWSVRELRRQINSLYFERSGLSKDKKALAKHVQSKAEKVSLLTTIQDPLVFEFLGLKSTDVMLESDLETALLDRLQEFIMELGHRFCFEARQKRILIGEEYFFIDLVFYHRILKCHVLIDLKVEAFEHSFVGQLNTYLNYYIENEMAEGDNPPVGLLLCTEKNHTLVRYAKAGMANKLFVSKYQLELPKKEELQKFIEEQLQELRHD
ncbi:DUF1016 family protein [candidate division KSB1 bacterium]|nr:DUF1016 family protein [candidate division KSB1 bacterium]